MYLNELISYNHHNNGIAISDFIIQNIFIKKFHLIIYQIQYKKRIFGYKWYFNKINLDFKPFLEKTQTLIN